MVKKRINLKFIIILVLASFVLFKLLNLERTVGLSNHKISVKLVNLGYNENDIKIIIDKVPHNCYNLINDYDESFIDLINSKNYHPKLFSKYYEYYSKNKKSNIQNIITIVNSGYNLMDYPASSLLASLVSEKYFIEKNVARYLDYGNSNDLPPKKIISIVNANADKEYYTDVKVSSLAHGYLVLVNKFYHLPDNYVPDDLVSLPTEYNNGTNNKIRKEAADAFINMADAALLDNIVLKNASAYRSFDYQVELYKSYVKRDGNENTDIYSARPGYSEHQTGLALDINTIDSSFHGTSESNWLINNSYKYGFIIRFPKNKEKITGYKYEPWHYRYVGKKAAKFIYKNDLTLEEYYAYYVDK